MEKPPAVRDLLLFLGQPVDLGLQVVIGQRLEIGKRFHAVSLSFGGRVTRWQVKQ
jgi:hypothetical protein